MTEQQTKILAIAGGSASGKTTLARRLQDQLGAAVIPLDAYYRHQPELALEERAVVDYDHPSAFEIDLLAEHLKRVRIGETVEIPRYDFSTHMRSDELVRIAPGRLVIIEGFFVLAFPELLPLIDHCVFVDAPSKIRFDRRLERDVAERGRTPESVRWQWESTVERGYLTFCEPTRELADLVVSGTEELELAVGQILTLIGYKPALNV